MMIALAIIGALVVLTILGVGVLFLATHIRVGNARRNSRKDSR
jgi:hypothetical protein